MKHQTHTRIISFCTTMGEKLFPANLWRKEADTQWRRSKLSYHVLWSICPQFDSELFVCDFDMVQECCLFMSTLIWTEKEVLFEHTNWNNHQRFLVFFCVVFVHENSNKFPLQHKTSKKYEYNDLGIWGVEANLVFSHRGFVQSSVRKSNMYCRSNWLSWVNIGGTCWV